jgi:hypothetical protein
VENGRRLPRSAGLATVRVRVCLFGQDQLAKPGFLQPVDLSVMADA